MKLRTATSPRPAGHLWPGEIFRDERWSRAGEVRGPIARVGRRCQAMRTPPLTLAKILRPSPCLV